MARIDSPRRRNRREHKYDDFRETLAATPARPYRDDISTGSDAVPTDPAYGRTYSPVEQMVRVAAGILGTLLVLRFVVSLFSSSANNAVVNVLYNATNWLVRPFQSVFGTPPSGGGGYFDLPALATIAAITLAAWVVSMLVRDYR